MNIEEIVKFKNSLNNLSLEELNKKKAELQKQIEDKTKAAAEKALKDAGISIPENEKLNNAIEKGASSLKGFLNKN